MAFRRKGQDQNGLREARVRSERRGLLQMSIQAGDDMGLDRWWQTREKMAQGLFRRGAHQDWGLDVGRG